MAEANRCLMYAGMVYAKEVLGERIESPGWFESTFPGCKESVREMFQMKTIPPANSSLPYGDGLAAFSMNLEDAAGIQSPELLELWKDQQKYGPVCVLRMTTAGAWVPANVLVLRGIVYYAVDAGCTAMFPDAEKPSTSDSKQKANSIDISRIIEAKYTSPIALEQVRPGAGAVSSALGQLEMTCTELITELQVFVFCSPLRSGVIKPLHKAILEHSSRLQSSKELSQLMTTTTKLVALGAAAGKIRGVSEAELQLLRAEVKVSGPAAPTADEVTRNASSGDSLLQEQEQILAEVTEHMSTAIALIERDEHHDRSEASLSRALSLVEQHQWLQNHLATQEGVTVAGVCGAFAGGTVGTFLLYYACFAGNDSFACFTIIAQMVASAARG
jgi:hypothetical protein